MKLISCLLLLATQTLHAQDITGTWQRASASPASTARIRLDILREDDGRLIVARYNVDGIGPATPWVSHSAMFDGKVLKAVFDAGDLEATFDAGANTLTGLWKPAANRGSAPPQHNTFARPTPSTAWRDSTAHQARFVAVEPNVKLEVLDFGGTGRPVVLLAGLGNNAHVFDQLAPKLTDRYHVYAITRRGFSPSSVPTSGYLSDSLADDVVAVLDSLNLKKPVLVGHSIAGQELSSIGSRHAARVAGLVYLDAANVYAYYDPAVENNAPYLLPDVQRKLATIFDQWAPISFAERTAMIRELADTSLPIVTRDLRLWADDLATAPNATERPKDLRRDPVVSKIYAGGQLYRHIQGPVLAIFVAPGPLPPDAPKDSAGRAAIDSMSLAFRMRQISAFQRGVPQARVARLAHASHFVWRSNEADVLREMRSFIDALPIAP